MTTYDILKKNLEKLDSMAVAFSGGIDSTLLAYMANKYVRGKVILFHIVSPFSITRETEFVRKWSTENKFNLKILKINALDIPEIQKNPRDRCYFCKKILMKTIINEAEKHNISYVADGTNKDDFNDYRPGIKASDELKIEHPFLNAGFGKKEIIETAKMLGLPNWDTPASACLASRIPYDTPITVNDLKMIAEAEDYLHKLGFKLNRVRKVDGTARIEVAVSKISELMYIGNEVETKLKQLGFKQISITPAGYIQGAMNN
jgi:uncharacterized protein